MANEPLNLLDDEPLNPAELPQFDQRLAPVIDTLWRKLYPAMQPGATAAQRGLRIGLFGGLGQGKSSVIRAVRAQLEALRTPRQVWRDRLWGSTIAQFDVSHYKAQDLEWRLLEAVVWQRVRRNAWWFFGLAAVQLVCGWISSLLWHGWSWMALWDTSLSVIVLWTVGWLLGIGAWGLRGLVVSGLSSLSKFWHEVDAVLPGKELGYTRKDLRALRLAAWFKASPALVIIDDLDRASVEQQRAVLRAAKRYSGLLDFALLVCMDESALLASEPNPEAPEELLRKVIHLELRLADRGLVDGVLLAASCSRQLVQRNGAHPLCKWLAQPLWVAQFSRVLACWPTPVSPRLVKRLLNDTLTLAEQLGVERPDQLAAALRCQALLQAAPGLHACGDELRRVLERNDGPGFARLLAQLQPALKTPRPQAVQQLFERSRALVPWWGDDWRHLVAGMRLNRVASGPQTLLNQAMTSSSPPKWDLCSAPMPAGNPSQVPEATTRWQTVRRRLRSVLNGALGRLPPTAQAPATASGPPPFSASVVLHRLEEWAEAQLAGHTEGHSVWRLQRAPDAANAGANEPTLVWLAPGLHDRNPAAKPSQGQKPPFDFASFPTAWYGSGHKPTAAYFGYVWALWSALLGGQPLHRRQAAYGGVAQAFMQGLKNTYEPQAFHIWLLLEEASDAEHWASLSGAQRQALVERLQASGHVAVLAWQLPLSREDLALAMRLLTHQGAPGELGRVRSRLDWLHAVVNPNPPGVTAGAAAGSVVHLWPEVIPESPDAQGWHAALLAHFSHWMQVAPASEPVLPNRLVDAWNAAACWLNRQQQFELLAVLLPPLDTQPEFLDRLAACARSLTGPQGNGVVPSGYTTRGEALEWNLPANLALCGFWWEALCDQPVTLRHLQALDKSVRARLLVGVATWAKTDALMNLVGHPSQKNPLSKDVVEALFAPHRSSWVGPNPTDAGMALAKRLVRALVQRNDPNDFGELISKLELVGYMEL